MNDSPGAWARPRRVPIREQRDINGLRYHVHRWQGPGLRVILLHGWMDVGAGFQFLADALPPAWDLIAPDWRGHGDTAWCDQGYWFPQYLADLDALLDDYSPQMPARLVGHSMGAQVASLYAGLRPERVAAAVCLDGLNIPEAPATDTPSRYRHWLEETRHPPEPRRYTSFQALAERLRHSRPALTPAQARFLAEAWARIDGDDVVLRADPRHRIPFPLPYPSEAARAVWAEAQAPILCIDGGRSPLAERLGETEITARRACFSDLRTEIIAGAGHMLHQEAPDEVAGLIADFLGMNRSD